jgi:hypothetical protein
VKRMSRLPSTMRYPAAPWSGANGTRPGDLGPGRRGAGPSEIPETVGLGAELVAEAGVRHPDERPGAL